MSAESSNAADNGRSINKDVIEAVNLLAHGKRNILCGEVSQAVTQLQEACRILAAEFGELADECGDSYLWYGKALLELFRMEGGVLGDAIPGTESEESEDSDDESGDQNSANDNDDDDDGEVDELEEGVLSEDLEEEEEDTGEPKEETDQQNNTNGTNGINTGSLPENSEDSNVAKDALETVVVANGNSGNTENPRSGTDETKENPSASQANENVADVANSSKQEPSDNDEISNLQLAWEMLELSKIIYQRHDRDDMKLKLAETYLKLGEIGMETEQYDQAVTDLSHCLSIQQSVLRPEDRRLAETLYQMGLACTYSRKYDTATGHYRAAMAIIQAKIDRLARVVAGEIPPDPDENGDGFYTPLELAKREIEELQALLPDISAKIDDVLDEQREADRVKVLMQETVAPSTSGFGNWSSDGASTSGFKPPAVTSEQPVNNISHLVRKKRKSEDDSNQHSDLQKRQKTSEEMTVESNHVKGSVQSDNPEAATTTPALVPEETVSAATPHSLDELQTSKEG